MAGENIVGDEGDVEHIVVIVVVVMLGGKSGLGRRWMGLGQGMWVWFLAAGSAATLHVVSKTTIPRTSH